MASSLCAAVENSSQNNVYGEDETAAKSEKKKKKKKKKKKNAATPFCQQEKPGRKGCACPDSLCDTEGKTLFFVRQNGRREEKEKREHRNTSHGSAAWHYLGDAGFRNAGYAWHGGRLAAAMLATNSRRCGSSGGTTAAARSTRQSTLSALNVISRAALQDAHTLNAFPGNHLL